MVAFVKSWKIARQITNVSVRLVLQGIDVRRMKDPAQEETLAKIMVNVKMKAPTSYAFAKRDLLEKLVGGTSDHVPRASLVSMTEFANMKVRTLSVNAILVSMARSVR